MTLTLDDVRNMKFRMARRAGYEVIDVDQFVDQVEEAFAQLTEENEQLKKQVETLQAAAAKQGQESTAQSAAPASQSSPQTESHFAAPSAAQSGQPQQQSGSAQQGSAEQGADGRGSGPETVVVTTREEASPAVVRMVQIHTEIAERLVSEAREEADGIVADANRQAHEIITDARTKAERVESEARVNAERLRSDAQDRATALDQELKERRAEGLSSLETERDQLTDSVTKLRAWEKKYRGSLTGHLKSQIQQLESGVFEPDNAPALSEKSSGDTQQDRPGARARQEEASTSASGQGAGSQQSATPRLDALLGDQKN
ncbi:DivIVA domain-containing protein [Propionibacteriaceae bacterium Y1700]|uniref:DivIVA domain-containing protein n=1 Tax=Microlunatus sp. Y1700 TaxID=3418487 RepID=UPI003DA6E299